MKRSEKIKQSVDLRTYIERYGQFNHANKMSCPLPNHEDKTPSFVLMDKNNWKCFGGVHGSDCGGSVIDFVIQMDGLSLADAMDKLDGGMTANGNGSNGHVDMSKSPEIKQAKPPRATWRNMAEYEQLKYHVPVGTFAKWGCSDRVINNKAYMAMPANDTIDRLRNFSGSGAKYQPDWENPLAIEIKKRREEKKKNGIPLEQEDHIQAQWFGLQEVIERKFINDYLGKTLVLCNGQTSTMVAQHYGVPAFCKTDGENAIPQWLLPQLIALLSDGWKLYVALDCDNDGKGHAAAMKVITQLHQYRPAFVDFGGKDGFDLADFCDKYKYKSWDKLSEFVSGLPGSISEQAIDDINGGLRDIAKAQRNKAKSTIPQLIDAVESRIEILRSEHMPPENNTNPVTDAYQKYLEARENPQWITGLTCKIKSLTYRLGGFQDDAVYTWIGETGSGKTTLSISIAADLLEQAAGFIVVGEAGENQIINRLVGHLAQVPWASLAKGKIKITEFNKPDRFVPHTTEQHKRILDAYGKVMAWKKNGILNLRDDKITLTTANMKTQLRKAVEERGVKWAIMESNDNIPTAGMTSEYENISAAMLAFEDMARTHHIPVFTSSQGGRNTKGRADKKLKMQDGLGSNHVEGKSYALMTIYNHWHLIANEELTEKDNDALLYPKGTARIYVRKLRDDESGGYVTAKFVGGAGWYNFEG